MSLTRRLAGKLFVGLPPVRAPSVRVVKVCVIPADDGVGLLADGYYPVGHDECRCC